MSSNPKLQQLVEASGKGDVERIREILQSSPKLDINAKDPITERVALVEAARGGHLEAVRLLLEAGAGGDAAPNVKQDAFLRTCGAGHMEVIKLLLAHGASIHLKGHNDETPLLAACRWGREEVVRFLLENGADQTAVDNVGRSALMLAALRGSREIVELLLSYGVDIAERNMRKNSLEGDTVFHVACVESGAHEKMLPFLLGKGLKIDDVNSKGVTGLMKAVQAGAIQNVQFLLEHGADINHRDRFGLTPLMIASMQGREDVVKLLLGKGAAVDAKDSRGTTAMMYAKKPEVKELLVSYGVEKPVVVDLKNFEILHAPPCDKRLVNGLKESFAQYARLFMKTSVLVSGVDVKVTQIDAREYKVQYKVKVGGKTEDYELSLSNQCTAVRENIRLLGRILEDFAKRRGNLHRNARKRADEAALRTHVANQILRLDPMELFSGLQYIEEQISSGAAGPQMLFYAGEIYSWMSFFKSGNENRKLSDMTATLAVAGYLLGGLEDGPTPQKSFFEGLLLLALGYQAAALDSFGSTTPAEQLLAAYIRFDFDRMKSLERNPSVNKRLLGYLQGLAYSRSNQEALADRHYRKLIMDYPDFLLAFEYIADNGRLGLSRQIVDQYPGDLLEKHLALMKKFTRTDWIDRDQTLQQEIKKGISQTNRLQKWLKIHGMLVGHRLELKKEGKLLMPEFLSQFLVEDISNALLIYYRLEAQRLGREPEANAIVEMAKAAYPSGTIARVLELKNEKGRLGNAGLSVSFSEPETILVHNLILNYPARSRESVKLMKSYREKENPNAAGLYRLYQNYSRFFYAPVAREYLVRALDADPYQYEYYREILKFDSEGKYIEKGTRSIGHLYGFMTTVADWYRRNGKAEEAKTWYLRAMEKSPEQQAAYKELGQIYRTEKQYEKAIATWQKYLEHDDTSLFAVSIRNDIGNLWIEMGEYEKAYEIFLKAQVSGQEKAILGFALASEKTGKILQAEQEYKRAAERYPHSKAPAELGIFYLRQNNPDTAGQVLREYRRFHRPGYYFLELIDHCAGSGNPARAVELVKRIENVNQEEWKNRIVGALAWSFACKKYHKIAVDLVAPYMAMPWNSAIIDNYCRYFMDGRVGPAEELASKWLQRYKGEGFQCDALIRNLMREELYRETAIGLSEYLQDKNALARKNVGKYLIYMAIGWRMGDRDAHMKQRILQLLQTLPEDAWLKTRILFLLEEMNQKEFLKLADTGNKRAEHDYFLGLIRLKEGRREEAVKLLLISRENTDGGTQDAYWNAQDLLEKMASPQQERT